MLLKNILGLTRYMGCICIRPSQLSIIQMKQVRQSIQSFRYSTSHKSQRMNPYLPEKHKHEHICIKCGRIYVHYHFFRHESHKQHENQCPYEDCEYFHRGENSTNATKFSYYNCV